MSEKMDYRAEAQKLIKEWREFIATPLYERSFLDGKEMVDYVDQDSHTSDDKLQSLILALLDKVRQEQAAECAKHKPSFNLESCMADGCDWKFGNGKITWPEHISALGRK